MGHHRDSTRNHVLSKYKLRNIAEKNRNIPRNVAGICLATGNTGITSASSTTPLYFVVFTEREFLGLRKIILGTPQFGAWGSVVVKALRY
jgi:hypothetical protein